MIIAFTIFIIVLALLYFIYLILIGIGALVGLIVVGISELIEYIKDWFGKFKNRKQKGK